MSKYTLEDLNSIDYGVRKVSRFSWRAEFWAKNGEPLWIGDTHLFGRKRAIDDMLGMLSLLIDDTLPDAS